MRSLLGLEAWSEEAFARAECTDGVCKPKKTKQVAGSSNYIVPFGGHYC